MQYSFKIEQAIRAAAVLHQSQFRRGRAPYPYITHLFAVSCIIADYTRDEDVIIASLLHDTLDDTDYTGSELETDFGSRVRSIVQEVSEMAPHGDKKGWRERKEKYLKKLEQVHTDALMVVAADTIHNMRSIIEEYRENFEGYLADFGGTLEDRIFFYSTMRGILNIKLENGIVNEFNHVFTEFTAFAKENSEHT